MGFYHYWGFLDYDRAMEEFAIAERGAPNNIRLLIGIGAVRRRQGRAEEALTYFRKARGVDPRSRRPIQAIAETLSLLRLLKTATTFGDWLPYALWKLERHTGARPELTERQRRHPLVFGWPVILRLLSQRALR